MKQKTWTELQQDCSRKSSDSCYLLTSATDLPDIGRRWREHQTFSTMWGCSTSESITLLLSESLQRDRKKRQTQRKNKHKWWLCFLSSDLPTPPFLTLQLQELCFTCRAYFSSRNIWAEKQPIIQSSYFSQASISPAAAESKLQVWQPSGERSSGSLLWHRLRLGGLEEDWRNETYIRLCDTSSCLSGFTSISCIYASSSVAVCKRNSAFLWLLLNSTFMKQPTPLVRIKGSSW